MKPFRKTKTRFVACIHNTGYKASLERWKVYGVLEDPEAEGHQQLRVVDESGEDYLFPKRLFRAVRLSAAVARLHTGSRGERPRGGQKGRRAGSR